MVSKLLDIALLFPNVLCLIINVEREFSPTRTFLLSINHQIIWIIMAIGKPDKIVKNVPIADTIIVVGSNHHKIYFINAKLSITIPVFFEYSIKGIKDSKLNRMIGNNTAVKIAKYLTNTNLKEEIFLQ